MRCGGAIKLSLHRVINMSHQIIVDCLMTSTDRQMDEFAGWHRNMPSDKKIVAIKWSELLATHRMYVQ